MPKSTHSKRTELNIAGLGFWIRINNLKLKPNSFFLAQKGGMHGPTAEVKTLCLLSGRIFIPSTQRVYKKIMSDALLLFLGTDMP